MQRFANGNVALYGHPGQADWGVSGGEDRHQDEQAAERDVDLVENVAEDEKCEGHSKLNAIIDHHVDEEDVTRIFIESLLEEKEQRGLNLYLCITRSSSITLKFDLV